jgi:hypothetical protein
MESVKLDGQVQKEWRWLIAVYLFLAGVGGGAYLAGVIADLAGGPDWMLISKIGVFLGVPCVLIGTLFLLADLGTPSNAWRVWMKPKTSWIARGTIIIVFFMIFAAIHTAWWIWPFPGPLAANESARHLIGVLGAIFAFLTVIYTGLLLGYSQPIALWRTSGPVLRFRRVDRHHGYHADWPKPGRCGNTTGFPGQYRCRDTGFRDVQFNSLPVQRLQSARIEDLGKTPPYGRRGADSLAGCCRVRTGHSLFP